MSGSSQLERDLLPLRELGPALRKTVLFHVSHDAGTISRRRLERLAHVLDRHVFRGESPLQVCQALHISRQQFYLDLREAARRARNVLSRERNRSAALVMENPRRALISQASTFYEAGASKQALRILADLRTAPLPLADSSRLAALEFRILDDLQAFDGFAGTMSYLAAARERASDDPDGFLLDATLHWLSSNVAYYEGNRSGSMREFGAMLEVLRPRSSAGDRAATAALCEYGIAGTHMLQDFGVGSIDRVTAEEMLHEAHALLRDGDDLSPRLLPALHAQRATIYSGSLATAHRARSERAVAYRLGVERHAPRVVWQALSAEVSESVARGDRAHALACATALYESVHASDTIEWRPFARSRLALAYNAMGRFDDVAQLIPLQEAQRAPHDAHSILPLCEMLIARGRFADCVLLATTLAEHLDGIFHAAALTYRAHALFEMKQAVHALTDIREAIAMYDSLRGQSLFLVWSAHRTAYYITGNVRYRDMLLSIERALDEETPDAAPIGPAQRLTERHRQIAKLAATGATNRAIAAALHLSSRTVGNYLNVVYQRLGIRARWQLAEALRRYEQ